MITGTMTSRASKLTVELEISGAPTVEFGTEAHPEAATVTGLTIGYKVNESFHGNIGRADTEVTRIIYRVAGAFFDTAGIHPEFLDKPEEWPDWVRVLVEENTPES